MVGVVEGGGAATSIDQKWGWGKGITIIDVNEFNPARGRLGISGVLPSFRSKLEAMTRTSAR